MNALGTIERPWQRTLIRLGIAVSVAVIFVPGLWVVLAAFRPNVEIMSKPPVWIPHLTLENFEAMLGLLPSIELAIPVGHYFRNSIVASVTSTLVALAIGTMGGYAYCSAPQRRSGQKGIERLGD